MVKIFVDGEEAGLVTSSITAGPKKVSPQIVINAVNIEVVPMQKSGYFRNNQPSRSGFKVSCYHT